ncbi:T9SS type A sorting domain-containing protein [bacterium SCSIO 12643]|nr:T9SS type A sorting domain-containing protein [bacterium SCSIO 12643]
MKKIVLFIVLIASLGLQAQTTHTVINTNDSGLGSLRAIADSCVAGDTIRFSPSLIALGSDSIVLTTGEIAFDTNGVVIKGLYTVTDTLFISGNNNSRIFSFNGAGRVVLDSLVLVNGNGNGVSSGNGGAVYSYFCSDTLFVKNSKISGNTANQGGGICSTVATSFVSLINTTISGNVASSKGGGVYLYSNIPSPISILDSKVLGNTSANGGGVYCLSNNSIFYFIIIENSIISGNNASNLGGGIYCFSNSGSISLINSTLQGNTAFEGGGVYSKTKSSSIDIMNSMVLGNSAYNGAGVFSFSAGFQFDSCSSIMNVTNSTISGNVASNWGGGIVSYSRYSYNYASHGSTSSSFVNVVNSTVSGNSAPSGGGGIYSNSYSSCPSLINSSCLASSQVSLTNSTISGNSGTSGNGAGVYSKAYSTYTPFYSPSSIHTTSTIIAENGINSSGIYNSTVPTVISNGYNIFSDAPTGTISSDSINITTSQLNLLPLAFNGGTTQTMRPGPGSIAVDNGNPNDNSDAQNAPIVGTRDVGATEGCFALPSSISIAACNSYTVPSGNNTYTQSGIYKDTLTTNCGADSIVTINLSIVSQYLSVDTIVACSSYTWIDGITYTSNNNTAVDTLQSSGGCDSIVTLDLTILQPSSGIEMVTACDSYIWNGVTYNSSNNTALDTLVNAVGCDSIVVLDLTILNSTTSTITTAACDSYTSPSGNYIWVSSGTYMDTIPNSVNCDSILTINLTINYSSHHTDTVTACDIYTWIDGITYTSSNDTATQLYTKSNGCDSIITLDLTINTTQYVTDTIMACDSYTWVNGVTYTSNNNAAVDTLVSTSGCDSIVTLDLTILNSTTSTIAITTCDSYTSPSGNYVWTSSGTYMDTIPNSVNCDSIITVNLIINNSTTSTLTVTTCDSYTSPGGNVWMSSGTYLDTIPNSVNCDSIITINLTINTTQYVIDTIVACDSYTWIDGITYTTNNNTAIDTLLSSSGCDSIITLDLTINTTQYTTDVISSCSNYTWIDGITYTSNNNTAVDTLLSSSGCDSIVILDLTILQPSSGVEVVTVCDSYTWNGITYTSSNNTALDTLINAVGCDSIVTLNLTINNTQYVTDIVSACDSYTWIDGITYTSSNNTALDTLINAVGCDSIVTLNLTINNTQYVTDIVSACDSYTWIDGITYTSDNNTAVDTLISSSGCDSIVTLDLMILNSTSFTDVITSCSPIVWIDGVTYNQTTNGPTYTLMNSQGCDSIVTLDFTLLDVDTSVTRNNLTLTAQATNAIYQWIDCLNGPIVGATNSSFTAIANGNYQVEVSQNGCVDTSACFSITNVGIQEAELIGVKLYPNPTSDVLHIDKGSHQSLEITLTNSAGAIVYQSTSKKQITSIDMSKMATGMYVVTLKNELGVKVEKVVKR